MPPDRGHLYTGPLHVVSTGLTAEETSEYTRLARLMIGRRGAAASSGVDTFSASRIMPNGVTIKVMNSFGLFKAYLHKRGSDEPDQPPPEFEEGYPTPYAGIVAGGNLVDKDIGKGETAQALDKFAALGETPKRFGRLITAKRNTLAALNKALSNPDADRAKLEGQIRLTEFELATLREDTAPHESSVFNLNVPKRWNSAYGNPVQPPLSNPTKKMAVFSQYKLLKPTMYSGRMRAIVQLVMGYGDQPVYSIVRREDGTYYPAVSPTLAPGELVFAAPRVLELPDDTESRKHLGAVRYWCQFNKTHGVYVSNDRRFYLIEISAAYGVIAMRLPVVPNSKELVPEAAQDFVDDLPLGYTFPRDFLTDGEKAMGKTETPFKAAVRMGWVKVLLDNDKLAEFYKLQGTYRDCGWAFSESGRKADNVGYHYPMPRPYDYPVFQHWSIEISGGDTPKVGTVGGGKGGGIYDYAHDDKAGYDEAIDSLEASIRMVSEGPVVEIAKVYQPLKVPIVDSETGVPAVVSFDMRPRGFPTRWTTLPGDYAKAVGQYPRCDTTVHVFYDGEVLKYLRFYRPKPGEVKTETESFDERESGGYFHKCMILGSYSWGSATKVSGTPTGFYSNDYDHRIGGFEAESNYKSQGKKVWESPYMGIAYSFPYPPFHFGYEDSGDYDEWYNQFAADYTSNVGSPWTGKRHAFWVNVKGNWYTGRTYASSAAIPMTDRECFFMCLREHTASSGTHDYQYTAMVMQLVYYTAPSWVPNPGNGFTIQFPNGMEWWQLRDDTVKYTAWKYWDEEHNYTKEKEEPPSTIVSQVAGVHTAPTQDYNRSTSKDATNKYTVETVASRGGYQFPMRADGGDNAVWENELPTADGTSRCAFLWCTRSVFGNDAGKMHERLDGAMRYYGSGSGVLDGTMKGSPHSQITFVGET